jgi:nucleotide-binding universal stress UspA family protein
MGKGNPTLGSFALEVVENMPVPMIAVPADAPASGISQIIYATDMQQLFVEMSILVPYARAFGAAVHILHIKPPGDQKVPAANDLVAQLQGQHAYNRISFTVRTGNDPEAAIHRFAREQEADLLAVFARPKNIFEKMFSKSITEQISHHTRIPLFLFRT